MLKPSRQAGRQCTVEWWSHNVSVEVGSEPKPKNCSLEAEACQEVSWRENTPKRWKDKVPSGVFGQNWIFYEIEREQEKACQDWLIWTEVILNIILSKHIIVLYRLYRRGLEHSLHGREDACVSRLSLSLNAFLFLKWQRKLCRLCKYVFFMATWTHCVFPVMLFFFTLRATLQTTQWFYKKQITF